MITSIQIGPMCVWVDAYRKLKYTLDKALDGGLPGAVGQTALVVANKCVKIPRLSGND